MEKHQNVRLAPTWYIVRSKKYFDIRRTTIEISQSQNIMDVINLVR